MLAKVNSCTSVGLESVLIEVEVDIIKKALPTFKIVGLPGKAVEEAKERIRSAIKNSQLKFPRYKITINLSPADLPKEGPSFDLPMALGILLANGELKADLSNSLILGELSLDGSLRHTKGVLPLAIFAKENGFKNIFVPTANAKEASIIKSIKVFAVDSLAQLINHLSQIDLIIPQPYTPFAELRQDIDFDFDIAEIVGQEQAKRALEIAAAGGHNVFLTGPPGAGKTLLARTLPSIMPELTEEEALEVTKIYSITGNIPVGQSVIKNRPFRSPHHTTSRIGLIGGGSHPQPGEISLAHRGVLFLDEFPEFPRHVLESLRQPMEDGIVQVSRAAGTMHFPAKFLLIAASNPCPCGYLGSEKKHCTCMSGQVVRYRKRISGPLLDRIDIHLTVPEVKVEKLTKELIKDSAKLNRETSKVVRARVQRARKKQIKRFRPKDDDPLDNKKLIVSNAEMSTKMVKQFCPLDNECINMMHQAVSQMNLSARAYFRIVKVARTIADSEGSDYIKSTHIGEALQYRPREDSY